MHSKVRPVSRQNGFTLIEVLVAFIILAVGLLGIVSLQALAKNNQHQAIQRARAVSIADTMVERIRINPSAIATYHIGLNPLGGGTIADEPNPDCNVGACTTTQLAAHDLWVWEQALDGASVTAGGANAGGLVSPQGCVVFNASPGMVRSGTLNVIVQWSGLLESRDAVQPGEVTCGGANAGTDAFRRQVSINTFIIDEEEL